MSQAVPWPLYDFVLVRPTGFADRGSRLLHLPTPEAKRSQPLLVGKVIAIGPGDKLITWKCQICGNMKTTTAWSDGTETHGAPGACPHRSPAQAWRQISVSRAAMHVKSGDYVVFPRVPANRVTIDGAQHVLLHEQQHVLAVIED